MFWENETAIAEIEDLAARQRNSGNLIQAKSLYTCLIAMSRKKFGSESRELALNFYRLAECYSDEDNAEAARTYHQRAAEIWGKTHKMLRDSPLWFGQAMHELQMNADSSQAQVEQRKKRA